MLSLKMLCKRDFTSLYIGNGSARKSQTVNPGVHHLEHHLLQNPAILCGCFWGRNTLLSLRDICSSLRLNYYTLICNANFFRMSFQFYLYITSKLLVKFMYNSLGVEWLCTLIVRNLTLATNSKKFYQYNFAGADFKYYKFLRTTLK